MLYHDDAGELSAHFRGSEFACGCGCGRALVSMDLVRALEQLRSVRGLPVIVVSGFRCCVRQFEIDGALGLRRSFHTIGQAADVWIRGLTIEELHRLARVEWFGLRRGGVGFYEGYVHLDIGAVRSWDSPYHGLDSIKYQ